MVHDPCLPGTPGVCPPGGMCPSLPGGFDGEDGCLADRDWAEVPKIRGDFSTGERTHTHILYIYIYGCIYICRKQMEIMMMMMMMIDD